MRSERPQRFQLLSAGRRMDRDAGGHYALPLPLLPSPLLTGSTNASARSLPASAWLSHMPQLLSPLDWRNAATLSVDFGSLPSLPSEPRLDEVSA
jgi:hypothetical protein